jgi:hypothetical protein
LFAAFGYKKAVVDKHCPSNKLDNKKSQIKEKLIVKKDKKDKKDNKK